MSKNSTIRRHVKTSIVARTIYRLVCFTLMVAGILGIYFTYTVIDRYFAYTVRNETTTATVTSIAEQMDEAYNYNTCKIEYYFDVDDKEYTSSTSPEQLPTAVNCYLGEGEVINIRYETNNPANNAFGDNTFSKELILAASIALAILSILALGCGYIGLIAIHKAMKAEDDLEEEEAKRIYRRQTKLSRVNCNEEK